MLLFHVILCVKEHVYSHESVQMNNITYIVIDINTEWVHMHVHYNVHHNTAIHIHVHVHVHTHMCRPHEVIQQTLKSFV